MVFRSSINITIQGADKQIKTKTFSDLVGLPGLTTECGARPVSRWPADQSQARDGFFRPL